MGDRESCNVTELQQRSRLSYLFYLTLRIRINKSKDIEGYGIEIRIGTSYFLECLTGGTCACFRCTGSESGWFTVSIFSKVKGERAV